MAFIDVGVPGEKASTLYEGTPLPPLEEIPPSPQRKAEEFRFCTLCRLIEAKGLLDLVRAASLIRKRGVLMRVAIVGNDDPSEPDFRSRLHAQITREGVEDIVTVHPFVSNPVEFLRTQHCLINPSHREGLPMAILEAMALGLPAIATDAGGTSELLVHGVTGLIVPKSDPAALADAMLSLAISSEKRKQYADASRARVEDQFSLERTTQLQEEFLAGWIRSVR
jgi:glycosyltransferase involved in cell wall biosynthesis